MTGEDEKRRQLNAVERLAVQEALQNALKDEVDDLKPAIIELTKQVTGLAAVMNERSNVLSSSDLDLAKRMSRVETALTSIKGFAAGISFACGAAGGAIGILIEWASKLGTKVHGGG